MQHAVLLQRAKKETVLQAITINMVLHNSSTVGLMRGSVVLGTITSLLRITQFPTSVAKYGAT